MQAGEQVCLGGRWGWVGGLLVLPVGGRGLGVGDIGWRGFKVRCRDGPDGGLGGADDPFVAGGDAQFLKPRPQRLEGSVGVAVEGGATDTLKRPPGAFKHLLASPVLVPDVWAVPAVPVAFDREAGVGAFDHDVDAVTADVVLDADTPVAAGEDAADDSPLEVGLAAALQAFHVRVKGLGVAAVADEGAAGIAAWEAVR